MEAVLPDPQVRQCQCLGAFRDVVLGAYPGHRQSAGRPTRRSYWIGEPERNDHWETWFDHAEKKDGTWWADWTAWLGSRCGELVEAYPAANRAFPALADAPGTYVLEK